MEKWSKVKKEGLLKDYPSLAWLEEFVDHYTSVVNLDIYRSYLEASSRLRAGEDPTPNRDEHKELLLEMGHDQAMLILPADNLFRKFILWRAAFRENYMALHGVCVARLMVHYPVPFERETILRLHGLLDRLLFGGARFAEITEVPAVGPWFWENLRAVKMEKSLLGVGIASVRKHKAFEEFGTTIAKQVPVVESSSMHLLSASSAFRNGRRRINYDDVRDAATALTELFHVDVTRLEPPRRVPPPAEAAAASR